MATKNAGFGDVLFKSTQGEIRIGFAKGGLSLADLVRQVTSFEV
jgi:hypothetical protein